MALNRFFRREGTSGCSFFSSRVPTSVFEIGGIARHQKASSPAGFNICKAFARMNAPARRPNPLRQTSRSFATRGLAGRPPATAYPAASFSKKKPLTEAFSNTDFKEQTGEPDS